MKKVTFLAAVVALLVCTPPLAAIEIERCVGTVLYIHSFASPADQHDMLRREAFDHGPDAVQATVLPSAPNVGRRYLVLVTACDAYETVTCNSARRRVVRSEAAGGPDDDPLEFERVEDIVAAAALLAQHADAAASGHLSLADGSVAVYWTKASR